MESSRTRKYSYLIGKLEDLRIYISQVFWKIRWSTMLMVTNDILETSEIWLICAWFKAQSRKTKENFRDKHQYIQSSAYLTAANKYLDKFLFIFRYVDAKSGSHIGVTVQESNLSNSIIYRTLLNKTKEYCCMFGDRYGR